MPESVSVSARGEREWATFQTDAVALETLHSLLEEVLASGRHTGDIVLLPLDGCIDIVEYLFHGVGDFSTNPVTGNERHLVCISTT